MQMIPNKICVNQREKNQRWSARKKKIHLTQLFAD